MIAMPGRFTLVLCSAMTVGWVSPLWGQLVTPDSTPPPPITLAEQKVLGGFYEAYRLKTGEMAKHFIPPFHPGRSIYYRHNRPPWLIRKGKKEPDSYFYRWRANELESVSGAVWGVGTLRDLIPILPGLDFHPCEIEGDEELLKMPIGGDWILRDGVPDEQLVVAMGEILREQLKMPVKISVQELDREVLLAEGDFRFAPIGHSKGIEIYAQAIVKEGNGGGSGDLDGFLRTVSRFIHQRVISNVQHPPENKLHWRNNLPVSAAMAREDIDAILKHVTEQTGLTFSPGVRRVRVLMVERQQPIKPLADQGAT